MNGWGHKSYILCERALTCVQLNDWETAVDNLIDCSNWSGAMHLIRSVKDGSVKYSLIGSQDQIDAVIEKTR